MRCADGSFGDAQCVFQWAVLQQQSELVAAESGEQCIAYAHMPLQLLGDLAQQLVSGRVSAGVVDDLELIQVHIADDMLDVVQFSPPNGHAAVCPACCSKPVRLTSWVSESWGLVRQLLHQFVSIGRCA